LTSHDANRGVELTFPLGIGYLAAVLKNAGYKDISVLDTLAESKGYFEKYKDTKFYNFGLSQQNIEERIRAYSPDIVGITCSFTKRFGNVLDIAKSVKTINPGIKVIVGGAHPSAMPEEVIKCEEIDYVLIGEAEESFLQLVDNLVKKKGSITDIDGLSYKDSSGRAHINNKTKFIGDIDSIPFPYREIFPMDLYLKSKRNSIITSRGCPFNCAFCSIHCVWGSNWRGRSAKNVVDEIELLVKNYNVEFISFEDDNLTFNRGRAQEIFRGIRERGLKIYWNTPNGVSIVNLDKMLLQEMKESGCFALNLAIESGDEFILRKVMKKPTSLDMVRNVVGWCKELGILTLGYFVVGMPGETKESMQHSLVFAKELMLDVINVFIATPYPGSPLYEECLKKGYLKNKDLINYTAFDAVIETPQLSAQDVQKFSRYFVEEYNKFHDAGSSIPTAALKETIRRPTKELIKIVQDMHALKKSS
jgi:magnesium-protoporphyrin IX monomethyl ester (oxidative) cyclase